MAAYQCPLDDPRRVVKAVDKRLSQAARCVNINCNWASVPQEQRPACCKLEGDIPKEVSEEEENFLDTPY